MKNETDPELKFSLVRSNIGKPSGLVVNVEESRSKPWSLDMGSNPGFPEKLDGRHGPRDGRKK